jgi:spermidine synthase
VKPWELLGQTVAPDGTVIKLSRRADEYIILADDKSLMSSRMHGSEDALATLACQRARTLKQPCVLVGGLGMGFTLRATLDLLPPQAVVVVAEILPAVVEWNRGPLGALAERPLNDKRVAVEMADVATTLKSGRARFDAVLLDVDNSPAEFTISGNAALYDQSGIAAAHASLKTEGVLAVWSARDDRKFEQRLRRGGFIVQVERVRSRQKQGGGHHAIFLASKPPSRGILC